LFLGLDFPGRFAAAKSLASLLRWQILEKLRQVRRLLFESSWVLRNTRIAC
jgi:hypothetical protein